MSTKGRSTENTTLITPPPPSDDGPASAADALQASLPLDANAHASHANGARARAHDAANGVEVSGIRAADGAEAVDLSTSTPPPSDVSSIQLSDGTKKKKKKKSSRSASAAPASGDAKPRRKSKRSASGESLTPPPVSASDVAPPAPKHDAAQARATRESREDEESVPPASDLDEHEEFFSAPVHAPLSLRSSGKPIVEVETRDLRAEQIASKAARERRAHLSRYVKAAVAVSLVLCFAAVLRVAIKRNHSEPDSIAMAATSPRPPAPQIVAEPAPETTADTTSTAAAEPAAAAADTTNAAPADTTPPTTAAAEPAKTAEPAKADEPKPSEPAAAAAATTTDPAPAAVDPAAPVEPDPVAAKKEKRLSQIALERGKNDDAIAAGERSVKLDPTDAEAWLILGAAYQAKGKGLEARRCFMSCIKEGKRGPKGECGAMLR